MIYDENFVVRSIPAVHGIDGSVSFILEWKGLHLVYGGHSVLNQWYNELG